MVEETDNNFYEYEWFKILMTEDLVTPENHMDAVIFSFTIALLGYIIQNAPKTMLPLQFFIMKGGSMLMLSVETLNILFSIYLS